jgi:RimJ/RimL family protein N-acetyltransferase
MPHVLFRSGEQTAHTRLLLPGPSMYDFLYSLALEAGEGFTWKGRPQTRGAIEEVCWADTFDHAVICKRANGEPIGYTALTKWNCHHGTVYISAYIRQDLHRTAAAFEAIGLLIYRMFKYTSCRKVYVEMTEKTFESTGFADVFRVEGHLHDYLIVRGERTDLIIASVDGDAIAERIEPHLVRWGLEAPSVTI